MATLDVTELDFDTIRQNFKTFLGEQSELQDYDFDGSAMATILDVMAYGIHYTGVYGNMALTESDMLSAIVRKNVVAGAKSIGYIPSSPHGAQANFLLTLDLTSKTGTIPTTFTVLKGTNFSAIAEDGSSVNFVAYDDNTLTDTGISSGQPASKVLQGTVFVVQGEFGTQAWRKDGTTTQRFILTQPDIDNSFLQVTIQENGEFDQFEKNIWTKESNMVNVGPETEAYFVSEVENELVEVYFGNDTIGKALQNGNFITVEYIATLGASGNNLSTYTLDTGIGSYSRTLFTVSNDTKSAGGADREGIESIKHNAPLDYQRQNRVVTIDDYKAIVLREFPNIVAINAWGGEDADPPEYGKVFVSVKPITGDVVSPATRKSIETDILAKFNVVGITPILLDPSFTECNFDVTVNYNKDKTTLKASEIETQVQAAIEDHFDTAVFDYEQSFKYSKLMSVIDDVHRSIQNNYTTVTISKEITPANNTSLSYTITFNNAIEPGTVTTGDWTRTDATIASLRDDGLGIMDLIVGGLVVVKNVGTVDYSIGKISLPDFSPLMQNAGDKIRFTTVPVKHDVDVLRNDLLILGTNIIVAEAVERFAD
jgi:hypothetical protein